MTFKEYFEEVKAKALSYDYDLSAIECFLCDILECYNNNTSVEECVDELF